MRVTWRNDEIKAIATHPSVWPGFGGKADSSNWSPPIRDGVDWLIGDGVIVCFMQMRAKTWEAHIGALPEARGTVKAQALEAIQWLREHRGPDLLLLGTIGKGNYVALANAKAIGMKVLQKFSDRTTVWMEV